MGVYIGDIMSPAHSTRVHRDAGEAIDERILRGVFGRRRQEWGQFDLEGKLDEGRRFLVSIHRLTETLQMNGKHQRLREQQELLGGLPQYKAAVVLILCNVWRSLDLQLFCTLHLLRSDLWPPLCVICSLLLLDLDILDCVCTGPSSALCPLLCRRSRCFLVGITSWLFFSG